MRRVEASPEGVRGGGLPGRVKVGAGLLHAGARGRRRLVAASGTHRTRRSIQIILISFLRDILVKDLVKEEKNYQMIPEIHYFVNLLECVELSNQIS